MKINKKYFELWLEAQISFSMAVTQKCHPEYGIHQWRDDYQKCDSSLTDYIHELVKKKLEFNGNRLLLKQNWFSYFLSDEDNKGVLNRVFLLIQN